MPTGARETAHSLLRQSADVARLIALDRRRAARGRVHAIRAGPPPADLAERLDRFERRVVLRFTEGSRYCRVHGPDFNAHYRTLGGPSVTLVLEEDGVVLGTQCLLLKSLNVPGQAPVRFVYAMNIRVAPEARFGVALARLQLAGLRWAIPRCWRLLILVPDATATHPRSRSGRFGIPTIAPVGFCERLVIPLDRAAPIAEAERAASDPKTVRGLNATLNRDRIWPRPGRPEERSLAPPVWLALPDGSACGCLEDHRRTRRYAGPDGDPEVIWRGLSHIAAASDEAAETLCRVACAHAARIGPDPITLVTGRRRAGSLYQRFGLTARRIGLTFHGTPTRRLPDVPWEFNVTEI